MKNDILFFDSEFPRRKPSSPVLSKQNRIGGPNSASPRNDIAHLVELLRSPDQDEVINATACLQHVVFCNSSLKEVTRHHGGIPLLVELLYSSDAQICRNAVGALRNLTCGDNIDIKDEFVMSDGIIAVAWLIENRHDISKPRPSSLESLGELRSPEFPVMENDFQPAIESGVAILCNLASDSQLKRLILEQAVLPCLVPHVITTTASKCVVINEKCKLDRMEEPAYISVLFRNVACVLRTISSCDANDMRESMRQCPGLLWGLITILQAAIKQNSSDTKSVEHCICTLRNLCYFVHPTGSPAEYLQPRSKSKNRKKWWKRSKGKSLDEDNLMNSTMFLPQHLKIFCEEDTLAMLVDLANTTANPCTLEATVRTMQNLTAHSSVFGPIARKILREMQALPLLVELLDTPARLVSVASADALRNMSLEDEACSLLGSNAMTRIIAALDKTATSFLLAITQSGESEWKWPQSSETNGIKTRRRPSAAQALRSDGNLVASLLNLCCVLIERQEENARRFVTAGGLEVIRQLMNTSEWNKCDQVGTEPTTFATVKKYVIELQKILWKISELRPVYKLAGWKQSDFIGKEQGRHNIFTGSKTQLQAPQSPKSAEERPKSSIGPDTPVPRLSKSHIRKNRDRLHSTVADVIRTPSGEKHFTPEPRLSLLSNSSAV